MDRCCGPDRHHRRRDYLVHSVMAAFWITLPDFDKSLVDRAVYGSQIAFCCRYDSISVYIHPGGGMKALTARQQEVFDLIRDHISQTGMPPTRAEIAQRLGFRSPNAAEISAGTKASSHCFRRITRDSSVAGRGRRVAAGRSCGCR